MVGLALKTEITQMHANLCSALADTNRILILYALSEKRMNVTELANHLGISQPATSRHLKLLREQGLVQTQRNGAMVEYRLFDTRLIEALDMLRAVLRERINYRSNLFQISEE